VDGIGERGGGGGGDDGVSAGKSGYIISETG
jgi:hypothetical protein